MSKIPLEDSFSDVAQKTARGLKLSESDLLSKAEVPAAAWEKVKNGDFEESSLRKFATVLNLHSEALLQLAQKSWYPQLHAVDGLASFNTTYEDMTVNSYLVWDLETREAAAFDTGATAAPMLELAREKGLKIKYILLTHTHPDHIADLEGLRKATGAPSFVSREEAVPGAELISEGTSFSLGSLKIETRATTGHSKGGITYVVSGLQRPVAVVGDAIFASSMGGGIVSFPDALENNRKKIMTLPDDTILCPGHGPLTSVAEEKAHNPFFPEFKK